MSAPEAIDVTAPSGFVHVGWRWKRPHDDEWSTSYTLKKPDLGFTSEYAAKVEWEPLFGYSELPGNAAHEDVRAVADEILTKNEGKDDADVVSVSLGFLRDLNALVYKAKDQKLNVEEAKSFLEAIANDFEPAVEHMYRPNESIFGAVARDMVKAGWSIFPQEIDGNRRPGTVNGQMIKWSEEHKLATQLPTEKALDLWTAQCAGLNVAVVLGAGSGHSLVLDVDIVENELSRQVQELADKMFGYTPLRRVGNFPKIALVYRHDPDDEIPNRSPKFVPFDTPENPDGVDQGLEVISDGKPMTFFGKHHKTGRYFTWLDANPQFFGPEDAPLVTSQQINDFFDAVDSLRQFSRSASFEGTMATQKWDEDAQINVPKIRSAAGARDWIEDENGKVVDGHEIYLTRLAFRFVTANPGTSTTLQGRESLIKIIVQQFNDTAECPDRWKGDNLIHEVESKVNRIAEKLKTAQIKPFVPFRDNKAVKRKAK
ncbi:bifunctional DNA primase/polymerase [Mesorhizobium sp. SP-1A]|uniref:bifunctional DNA primase/polymerase n=1 Tax=Mesorhizobium sp. SP-1A TaxID=3077840 RepID=UPI0028F71C4C|nr:bifunctional DNA primase/polymerase [Mesorhizobium sp. SP-1A]